MALGGRGPLGMQKRRPVYCTRKPLRLWLSPQAHSYSQSRPCCPGEDESDTTVTAGRVRSHRLKEDTQEKENPASCRWKLPAAERKQRHP